MNLGLFKHSGFFWRGRGGGGGFVFLPDNKRGEETLREDSRDWTNSSRAEREKREEHTTRQEGHQSRLEKRGETNRRQKKKSLHDPHPKSARSFRGQRALIQCCLTAPCFVLGEELRVFCAFFVFFHLGDGNPV